MRCAEAISAFSRASQPDRRFYVPLVCILPPLTATLMPISSPAICAIPCCFHARHNTMIAALMLRQRACSDVAILPVIRRAARATTPMMFATPADARC